MSVTQFVVLTLLISTMCFGAVLFRVLSWIDRAEVKFETAEQRLRLASKCAVSATADAAANRHRLDSIESRLKPVDSVDAA